MIARVWAAVEAELVRCLGAEGAAAWLRFKADLIERDERRRQSDARMVKR